MRLFALAVLAPAVALAEGGRFDVPLPPPPVPRAATAAPASPSGAVPVDGAAPASPASAAPPAAARPLPRFGLLLDAGVPDGAALALMYRPWPSVRSSLGGSWNGLGYGFQGGLGWTPFRWAVSPSVNLEAGDYLDADLTWVVDGTDRDGLRPLLRHVGYRYVTGQLGLEFGSPRGFSFFLRAGASYLWTRVSGTGTSTSGSGDAQTTVSITDPRVRATLPSAKLGVLFWF